MGILILILLLAVISSILYRAGGLGRNEKYWIPKWLRHSWCRDWLCPACILAPLFIKQPSWWYILAYGTLGACFSTYWDWLFKGEDNFWFSGFMLGIALFPLLFCGFIWWHLLIHAFCLAVIWGAWCAIFSNPYVEEHGRGFFSVFTIIIILKLMNLI